MSQECAFAARSRTSSGSQVFSSLPICAGLQEELTRPSLELAASLGSLGKIAWVQLDNDKVRFTVIPEQGSQVWAVLSIDSIFEDYTIQSASPNNVIHLEVPIQHLHRALRSSWDATSASIRLTKKNEAPVLCITISTHSTSGNSPHGGSLDDRDPDDDLLEPEPRYNSDRRNRETVVTQDVAVKVLPLTTVEGLHEPQCRDPDVHVFLPPLLQMKSISERFVRLASASSATTNNSASGPKLELEGNMFGSLKLSISTDAMSISSLWTGLEHPELNLEVTGNIDNHPSTRMRQLGEENWAKVRIDGKDWARVLSIGRIGGRYVACIVDDTALILYVYLPNDIDGDEDSVLTYYISSFTV